MRVIERPKDHGQSTRAKHCSTTSQNKLYPSTFEVLCFRTNQQNPSECLEVFLGRFHPCSFCCYLLWCLDLIYPAWLKPDFVFFKILPNPHDHDHPQQCMIGLIFLKRQQGKKDCGSLIREQFRFCTPLLQIENWISLDSNGTLFILIVQVLENRKKRS